MIELSLATKQFETETIQTTALNKVNLSIEQGEFVSIMGPSGSGKTTLLNILGMFENLDTGNYTLLDKSVRELSYGARLELRRECLGYVFQSFNLIPHLSVLENVELPLKYRGYKRLDRKRLALESLEKMSLGNRVDHMPYQISGGQQQRVAIARACVSKPTLILADEPTGNLDTTSGQTVLDALCDINRNGTTIVMVTHSKVAASMSSRKLNMVDGQIVDFGGKGN
ncbi:ABC transporter ATP-binding protein [Photobacterium kasasachensis]|uniref:ABC transporter ATP-binding protein n=1 Tax=Photobacterium kasasachensis TaxID=2910240 RepID=UPI003D1463E7